MKELSLNILDIAQNSVKAGADTVRISLTEMDGILTIRIEDNGCGMKEDFLRAVTDPFTTTRTTRSVGMGIPLFKLAAEQTGGAFSIASRHEEEHPDDHGTVTEASFCQSHLDYTPLGDIVSTLCVLIQGSPDIRWIFTHRTCSGEIALDTAQLKEVLGDVPLNNSEVINWIDGYLKEQYEDIGYQFN